jgi:hypothetical protein
MPTSQDHEHCPPEPRHSAGIGITETRWQDRPMLSMQLASELSALSVASVYRASDDKRLVLRKLYGRTLVVTSSLIDLLNSAEP